MYGRGLTRWAVLAAFAALASQSPPFDRYGFTLDGWLGLALGRHLGNDFRWLPILVFGAGILADALATWTPRCSFRVLHPRRWAVAVAVIAAAVFWAVRIPESLGDLRDIDVAPIPRLGFQLSEPLGQILSTLVRMLGARLGLKGSIAVGLETVLYGSTAVAALFLWSQMVSAQWPLVFAMLISSGFMVIFCGYVEISTPKAVAVGCWYVYFMTKAIRDWRSRDLFLANASLSLAGLIHGSALCWLPAHVWCIARHRRGRSPVTAALAGFLAPVAGWIVLFLVVHPQLWSFGGNILAPLQWFSAYCVTNCDLKFWSMSHLLDVVNCPLMLAPMAVLCLPEAFWRARSVTTRWLAIGALGWMVLLIFWFPMFGHVADWDIFAAVPLAFSCFTIVVAAEVMDEMPFRRLACGWIVISCIHTFGWWSWLTSPP